MEVIVSEYAGFCSGAKRAVDCVENALKDTRKVVTLGEIIHNTQVVDDLKLRGVNIIYSLTDLSEKLNYMFKEVTVVTRSHGITESIESDLKNNRIRYIDATCPFVKKTHTIVQYKVKHRDFLLVLGTKMHPEVEGICSRFKNKCFVFRNLQELEEIYNSNQELFDAKKGALVAQTTYLIEEWQKIVEYIEKKFENIAIFDTICKVTDERQKSTEEIAKKADFMVVVGSHQSSNTLKLVEICNKHTTTLLVESWEDLQKIDNLTQFNIIGITAGSSTPIEEVRRVQNYLISLSKNNI